MKVRSAKSSELEVTKENDLGIHLYKDKDKGTLCYKDKNNNVIEVGSDTAALLALIASVGETVSYAEVAISSAEILTLGSSAVTLLPAPGADEYYDIKDLIIESTGGTTPYTLADPTLMIQIDGEYSYIDKNIINGGGVSFAKISTAVYSSADSYIHTAVQSTNSAVTITTDNGADPTVGNGTLLVKIWYVLRTIGTEL